jgi:hypothetical protein
MKTSMVKGVGMQFALEPRQSADAHYAGRGIKLNTPSPPSSSASPRGHRVIFAGLTVKREDAA